MFHTFSVAVGYTHACDPRNEGQKLPISIVTALVDRIGMFISTHCAQSKSSKASHGSSVCSTSEEEIRCVFDDI